LILEILGQHAKKFPDRAIEVRGVPRYADIVKNGVGYYFHDPDRAERDKVYSN
jgi:hypothetical protein